MKKVSVPRAVLSRLDQQVETQRKRVEEAQRHLDELEEARAKLEEMPGTGRERGGNARAEALSSDQRTEIASKAAKARWKRDVP